MANWAAAIVNTPDATYGTTAKGDQVQFTTRAGPGSVRVAKSGTVLVEKTGVVSDTGTSRLRTITFNDGDVWTVQRLRGGCGCGGR